MWHVGESVEVLTGVLKRELMEERPLGGQWHTFFFVFMMDGGIIVVRNINSYLQTELELHCFTVHFSVQ